MNDVNENRQKYKDRFYPNGAIFVFSRQAIITGEYYTQKTYAYIMNRKHSVDIDDQFDFELAKIIIENNI